MFDLITIIFLGLIVILVFFFTILSFWSFFIVRVPFVPFSRKKIEKILGFLNLEADRKIYDLGCGDGRVLKMAYERFGVRGIGFEINPLAYLLAKIGTWQYRQKIKIYRQNFLKICLGEPDYVFIYLFPGAMAELERKLLAEIKKPCQIISFIFYFPNLKPTKILEIKTGSKIEKVFVYSLND